MPSRPRMSVVLIMMSEADARNPGLLSAGARIGALRGRDMVTPVPCPPSPCAPWQAAQYCAYKALPCTGLPGRCSCICALGGFWPGQLRRWAMIAPTSLSLNCPKAGITLPGLPRRIVLRRYSSSTAERNAGSARGTPTPPWPSMPWHAEHCWLNRRAPSMGCSSARANAAASAKMANKPEK